MTFIFACIFFVMWFAIGAICRKIKHIEFICDSNTEHIGKIVDLMQEAQQEAKNDRNRKL